jgi:hypothetical protein
VLAGQVFCHVSHASSFCFSYCSDRVSHDPSTYTFCVSGTTEVKHHISLFVEMGSC